jgi:hypothetical protein
MMLEQLPSKTAVKSPPQAVKLLVPVWGSRYVKQFLDFSVPTLLAPGNLPSLAAKLRCEFEILTSVDDESYIRKHPAFARLSELCTVTIRYIDHLITARNYSTTITLAYAESVRASGSTMLETCFFFLVSDYIIADGSLGNVLERMMDGASSVLVGNFQVTVEEGLSWLRTRLGANGEPLVLNAREMMQWSLNHLHPATVANIVNNPLTHNVHTNRLFWRVDSNTLLGRFYLMHMICIRPEVIDFQIGSSCDYSFIPEMCPSGNVVVMNDSDKYLVIEMQPVNHESHFLRPGALPINDLAGSLSSWTTERHRANVSHTVVFHASDPPEEIQESISEADSFVDEIRRKLHRKPKSHRGHPYWLGAIGAFRDSKGQRSNEQEENWTRANQGFVNRLISGAITCVFGRAPRVFPWHPSWPDHTVVLKRLQPYLRDSNAQILTISELPTPFTNLLTQYGERTRRFETSLLLKSAAKRYQPLAKQFDVALVEMNESETKNVKDIIDKINPMMKDGGKILLVLRCHWSSADATARFIQSLPMDFRGAWASELLFVPLYRLRHAIYRAKYLLGAFIPLTLLLNLLTAWKTSSQMSSKHISTVFMELSPGLSTEALCVAAASEMRTREPAYDRCLEVEQEIGLTPLGLMTNQVWHDDPRRLTFVLARYKFVAKMLSGRSNVGELGCGDAFGTRIVLQEVSGLTAYDFDPVFIEDIQTRRSQRWTHEACAHDILSGPLPQKHDAIYSLDVIEHIDGSSEDLYLTNLCRSLEEDGVLIIGTPSQESQTYASPSSKIGHVNCKSGPELKSLLEKYFHSVFLFSMNDEVVHTGFYPMAHYLFVICSHKRKSSNG